MSLWRSHHSLSTTGARRDPACVGRLAPPSWLRSPLGLVACIAYVFQWRYDGKKPLIVSLEQLLVFLAFSWKMTFYLLPVSGPVILLQVDVCYVPGRSSHWLYDYPQCFEDQNILNVPNASILYTGSWYLG